MLLLRVATSCSSQLFLTPSTCCEAIMLLEGLLWMTLPNLLLIESIFVRCCIILQQRAGDNRCWSRCPAAKFSCLEWLLCLLVIRVDGLLDGISASLRIPFNKCNGWVNAKNERERESERERERERVDGCTSLFNVLSQRNQNTLGFMIYNWMDYNCSRPQYLNGIMSPPITSRCESDAQEV